MALITKTNSGSRLDQLTELSKILARSIDACDDSKSLAQLTKQYRETIKEIEEIKGVSDASDEISDLLSTRKADGKSGAVRKSRS